jgi:hypothetical protein
MQYNQKTDGQVGGKRALGLAASSSVSVLELTTDIRFTTLPLTNSLGEPIVCCKILQSNNKEIPSNWITGYDIMAPEIPVEDGESAVTYFRVNSDGIGKK